jgi:hypothetical protein
VYIAFRGYIVEKLNRFDPLINLHKSLTLTLARILAQGMLSQMAQDYNPNVLRRADRD